MMIVFICGTWCIILLLIFYEENGKSYKTADSYRVIKQLCSQQQTKQLYQVEKHNQDVKEQTIIILFSVHRRILFMLLQAAVLFAAKQC